MKQVVVKTKLVLALCLIAISSNVMAQTSTYTLTPNGIGPVQIGTRAFDLPESLPQLYASMVSDVFFDGVILDEEDMPEYATWYFYDEDGETVFIATSDSKGYITEITVTSPNFLTAEGLHVGSLRKQIEAVKGVLKIEANPLADYPQDSYLLNGATFTLDSYYYEGGLIGQDVVATISISDPILTPEGLGAVQLGIKATDLPESVPRLYASKVHQGADWHFLDEQGQELFTAKQDKDGTISEITVTAPSICSIMGLHVGMPLQQVEYISGLQWEKPDQTKDSFNCYDVNDITLNVNKPENQTIDKASSLVASMTVVGALSSDDLYEIVNNVIAEALPYYLTSSSLQEMETHLDEIRSIKSVESAYSNGTTTLFVDIKKAGPISFSFYPDESFEVSQESLEQLKNQLKPIPEEYSRTQWLNKFIIAYQMGDDKDRSNEEELLELAKKLFVSCNLNGGEITKPTVDFFLNDMYDYDYVFLNTHGFYDTKTRNHRLLTSTIVSENNKEQIKNAIERINGLKKALKGTDINEIISKELKTEIKSTIQKRGEYHTEDEIEEIINGIKEDREKLIQFLKESISEELKNTLLPNVFHKYESLFLKELISFDFIQERKKGLYNPLVDRCYVSVSEDLIRNSDKRFNKNAIIFNTACQSLMGDDDNQPNYSLADAFLQRGAGAYLGYDETNKTGRHAGIEFFGRLFSGMSINQAYETLDDIVVNDHWVDNNRKDKHEWTAHLRKRCATVRRANDYDGESSDFGDYGTYRPMLSNLSWSLRDQHLHLAIMATIPLHWYTTKQISKNTLLYGTILVDPEENAHIDAIPLEYGFEISKTADFKEKEELGRIGINDVKEDEIIDCSDNIMYAKERSKIESKLINGAVGFAMAYENKITKTYFADADTCCLRAFVFDGKNYTYSKYIVLRRNVSGQSYFGEMPDLITKVYNKAVNAGLVGFSFYAIDEVARNEYDALNKEVGKKIQEIKNQYIGKKIPVEGGSITHAVIDDIKNYENGATTIFYLRLYPSAVAANATWGNALYFVFLDEDNKLLDKKMAVSDLSDGRLVFNIESSGIGSRKVSPSWWNRFAKIVQVTKEEYNKWK